MTIDTWPPAVHPEEERVGGGRILRLHKVVEEVGAARCVCFHHAREVPCRGRRASREPGEAPDLRTRRRRTAPWYDGEAEEDEDEDACSLRGGRGEGQHHPKLIYPREFQETMPNGMAMCQLDHGIMMQPAAVAST